MKDKILVSAITSLCICILWTSVETACAKINEKETTVTTTEITTEVTTVETTAEETTEVPLTTVKAEDIPDYTDLGVFKLTAYCPCHYCCHYKKSDGTWNCGGKDTEKCKQLVANPETASGKKAKANHTVAADTSLLPFGTTIMIGGETFVVEDRGGAAIGGMVIDIFYESHEEANAHGIKYAKVYEVN